LPGEDTPVTDSGLDAKGRMEEKWEKIPLPINRSSEELCKGKGEKRKSFENFPFGVRKRRRGSILYKRGGILNHAREVPISGNTRPEKSTNHPQGCHLVERNQEESSGSDRFLFQEKGIPNRAQTLVFQSPKIMIGGKSEKRTENTQTFTNGGQTALTYRPKRTFRTR